jgi:hypothetical protein
MRIHWKLLVGFSLFGALVSLISGIAGGNPFGVIVLRLILSAVVFAALGLGVQGILRRYLPDLLQTSPPPVERGGGTVDIIIDDELPASAAGAQEGILEPEESTAEALGRAPPESEELLTESEFLEMGEGPQEAFEPADLGEFEAEPTLAQPTLAQPTLAQPTLAQPTLAQPTDEVREPPAARKSPVLAGSDEADPEILPEFDAIEDVADLASGLSDEEPESSDRRPPATPREMRQSRIEEAIKDQDPENLARAVRTFLKKDQ